RPAVFTRLYLAVMVPDAAELNVRVPGALSSAATLESELRSAIEPAEPGEVQAGAKFCPKLMSAMKKTLSRVAPDRSSFFILSIIASCYVCLVLGSQLW